MLTDRHVLALTASHGIRGRSGLFPNFYDNIVLRIIEGFAYTLTKIIDIISFGFLFKILIILFFYKFLFSYIFVLLVELQVRHC